MFDSLKGMKQEGDIHLKGLRPGFVSPLYAPIPVLGDGGPISKKEFVEKYEFCCEDLSPKHVRVPKDISLKDISKFFGPIVNKNGYSYEFTKDLVFIEKVEKLWMVVHQKPCMLAPRLIALGMVKGLACEKMGKKMNLAMYANWTNSEL
jgi:hypothetical protein